MPRAAWPPLVFLASALLAMAYGKVGQTPGPEDIGGTWLVHGLFAYGLARGVLWAWHHSLGQTGRGVAERAQWPEGRELGALTGLAIAAALGVVVGFSLVLRASQGAGAIVVGFLVAWLCLMHILARVETMTDPGCYGSVGCVVLVACSLVAGVLARWLHAACAAWWQWLLAQVR